MLQNAGSPDAATRTAAEGMLAQAAETQAGPFMAALAGELGNEARTPASRQQAGLYLKNLLRAEDDALAEEKSQRWIDKVDEASKVAVRNGLLQTLLSAEAVARHTSAQVIGAVAAIDLPNKQWVGPTGLISQILQCVTAAGVPETAKEAALEACGYVCEELEEGDLDPQQTNEVLTAIVDGIKAGRPEMTRLAAVTALQNSLGFCEANFGREAERSMLMTVVCEATQSTEPKVRAAAYEALANMVALYYKHIEQRYMDVLYPMTVATITGDAPEVAMMAVEFWSTLCEQEMELEGEENFNYMAKAAQHLLPTLLLTLEKQAEDAEDSDEWTLALAAAMCIQNIARTVEDDVMPHVLPYVEANAASPDWHKREAAIMAFGQIMDGPSAEQIAPFATQAMQLLVGGLVDVHSLVKDTTAWSLGRVAEFAPTAITEQAVMPLLTNLMAALDDSPRVAARACFVVHNMAENQDDIAGGAGNWLGPHVCGPLVQKLLATTERSDWEEENLRSSAYETLNRVVEGHGPECRPIVLELSTWVFEKMKGTFTAQTLTEEDRDQNSQLQSLLVAAMHYIISTCDEAEVLAFADTAMQLLLQVMQSKSALGAEEAFMCTGQLMNKLEGRFDRYLDAMMPLLIAGIQNSEEYQVCTAAVGCLGDLCRAVEAKVLPYCDTVMQVLLVCLENPSLKRDVKPPMLSVFGDLAMAIGPQFQRYLAPPSRAMVMLYQASKITVDMENEDMVEYMNCLHEGIIEAYTGIVNGLAEGDQAAIMLQVEVAPGVNCVAGLTEFFAKLPASAMEDEVCRGAVGLVGDVAKNVGKPSAPYLSQALVAPLLQQCAAILDEDADGNDVPDPKAQGVLQFAQTYLTAAHAP